MNGLVGLKKDSFGKVFVTVTFLLRKETLAKEKKNSIKNKCPHRDLNPGRGLERAECLAGLHHTRQVFFLHFGALI